MNKHLIESANKKGYVVKSVEDWGQNQFGKQHIITIEGGQYCITFNTNVLHGVNYFLIHSVTDYLNNRTYKASRYHHKFISLVSEIMGETHISLQEEPKTDEEEIEAINRDNGDPIAIIRHALAEIPHAETEEERNTLYQTIQEHLGYQEVTKTHVMEVWYIHDSLYFDKETAELFDDGKDYPQVQYIIAHEGVTIQEGADDYARYDSYEEALTELKEMNQ